MAHPGIEYGTLCSVGSYVTTESSGWISCIAVKYINIYGLQEWEHLIPR